MYPLSHALVVFSVLVGIVLMRRFIEVLPDIFSSVSRPRGGAKIEGNLRLSQDRNFVALALVIPFFLLVYRYRLYNPSFLASLPDNLRLGGIAAAFVLFFLLRQLFYVWLRPRRRGENYRIAHRSAYTHFIILVTVLLVAAGILALTGVQEPMCQRVLYILSGLVMLGFWVRFFQILSLSCNYFRSFLYLCSLEIGPLVLLAATAVLL